MEEEELDEIKKYIIDKSKLLKLYEHIEIFKLIKKQNISYTKNNNGVFINLNKMPESLILKIKDLILFSINSKSLLNIENKKRNKIKKLINDKSEIVDHQINIVNEEPIINVSHGIKYTKNNELDHNELYYAESNINIP
jgi:hypothetical protein|uniref:NET domain-containing protein n=1 Tax=Mimiviridae sp. ChoanoV1 TaxID=2596887 RepID=A0A5B8IIL7_9VIRU|nr:hypothetical protein 9_6 [Mimiviridae sp. ChoanoV1]